MDQGATGSLTAQGDAVLEGSPSPLSTNRFAEVNANGQNVVIGSPTGTGSVTLYVSSSLSTTGTLTIGFGGSSQGSVSMVGGFGLLGIEFASLNAGTLVVGDNNGFGMLGMQDISTVTVSDPSSVAMWGPLYSAFAARPLQCGAERIESRH